MAFFKIFFIRRFQNSIITFYVFNEIVVHYKFMLYNKIFLVRKRQEVFIENIVTKNKMLEFFIFLLFLSSSNIICDSASMNSYIRLLFFIFYFKCFFSILLMRKRVHNDDSYHIQIRIGRSLFI